MEYPKELLLVLVASELIAFYLLFKLWNSSDYLLFKIVLSFVAVIPVFGPLVVYWLGSWPSSQPKSLRDNAGEGGTDVFDRWRPVFEEKNEEEKIRKWKKAIRDD